jgi:autotransporter-associated beta strand protein
LTLSGTNLYTGTTTISAGTVQINSASSLGNGGAATISSATLQATQTFSTARTLHLGPASTILVDSGKIYSLGGTIDNAPTQSGTLTKAGSGVLEINTSASHSGGTAVTGGTLRGSGTIGTVAVQSGGTIGAGTGDSTAATTGTFTTGIQTWSSGGNYEWRVSDPNNGSAGTNWDVLNVAGETGSGAFTVTVDYVGATPAALTDQPFTIPIVVASGATNFNASNFTILVTPGNLQLLDPHRDTGNYSLLVDGGNLDIHYTPEPGSLGLFGIAALGLLRRRRRAAAAVR